METKAANILRGIVQTHQMTECSQGTSSQLQLQKVQIRFIKASSQSYGVSSAQAVGKYTKKWGRGKGREETDLSLKS